LAQIFEVGMVKRNLRNKRHQATYCVIPACEPGSSALGWQSPFATETGGLFQTGNSVASAEQTSAAPNLHQSALIRAFYPRKSAWTAWAGIQPFGDNHPAPKQTTPDHKTVSSRAGKAWQINQSWFMVTAQKTT